MTYLSAKWNSVSFRKYIQIYSRDIRCLEVLWGGIWWFTGSQSDNVVDFLLRQWLQSKFGRNRGFRGAPNNNGRWRWGVEKITKLERSLIHYGRCPKWSPSQHGPNVKPWRERKSVARGEERVTAERKLAAICLRRFFARKLFKNCSTLSDLGYCFVISLSKYFQKF